MIIGKIDELYRFTFLQDEVIFRDSIFPVQEDYC